MDPLIGTASLEITELKKVPLNVDLSAFTKKIMRELDIKSGSIEITFVDNKTLKKMNEEHLNHHYNTDIITFNLGTKEVPMGDIYISVTQAKKNAKELGHSPEKEIKTLIIHGLLHVLGMTDDTDESQAQMFKKQDELLELESITTYNGI